jgi:methionine synthase II (cobalamin-independent)
VVYSSKVGETREKEYAKAYNLALRDAFETYQTLGYTYQPNESILAKAKPQATTPTVSAKEKEEIARLKEEIKTLKEEQVPSVEVEKPIAEIKKAEKPNQEAMPKQKADAVVEKVEIASGMLYAQPIDNGFQIVDTTPKKVMILQNSGVKDVFKVEGKKAIVYKKGDVWMYSESGDILKGEVINIKF